MNEKYTSVSPQMYLLEWADNGLDFYMRSVRIFVWDPLRETKGEQLYYIKHKKRCSSYFRLYEGRGGEDMEWEADSGPASDEKSLAATVVDNTDRDNRLLDIEFAGCFRVESVLKDPSTGRSVKLSKAKGEGGEPFWSINRSMDDFDGEHFKFNTKLGCNYVITRTRDKTEVARWHNCKLSFQEVGKLAVSESLKPMQLQLLLCATFIKFLQDRRRHIKY